MVFFFFRAFDREGRRSPLSLFSSLFFVSYLLQQHRVRGHGHDTHEVVVCGCCSSSACGVRRCCSVCSCSRSSVWPGLLAGPPPAAVLLRPSRRLGEMRRGMLRRALVGGAAGPGLSCSSSSRVCCRIHLAPPFFVESEKCLFETQKFLSERLCSPRAPSPSFTLFPPSRKKTQLDLSRFDAQIYGRDRRRHRVLLEVAAAAGLIAGFGSGGAVEPTENCCCCESNRAN